MKTKTNKSFDENLNLYKLEKEWRSSQSRYTEKELLKIFPEVKEIIPEKIQELEEAREKLFNIIKNKITIIKHKNLDDFSYWFWREYIKIFYGKDMKEIDREIIRLKRLSSISKGKKIKGIIDEEEIHKALSVPIEDVINQQLKKKGKVLVGLCPLHNEKTPSFYVYPESNSFYCFGCKQGGNNINLIKSLYNYSFKEAVKHINN
jgi:hypothetical protein